MLNLLSYLDKLCAYNYARCISSNFCVFISVCSYVMDLVPLDIPLCVLTHVLAPAGRLACYAHF